MNTSLAPEEAHAAGVWQIMHTHGQVAQQLASEAPNKPPLFMETGLATAHKRKCGVQVT